MGSAVDWWLPERSEWHSEPRMAQTIRPKLPSVPHTAGVLREANAVYAPVAQFKRKAT
jgi:hypothetical protein